MRKRRKIVRIDASQRRKTEKDTESEGEKRGSHRKFKLRWVVTVCLGGQRSGPGLMLEAQDVRAGKRSFSVRTDPFSCILSMGLFTL